MIEEGFEQWPRIKNDETQRRLSHLKSKPSNRRLEEIKMAKTKATKKRAIRREWTRGEVKELKKHSKDKTRVKAISRALKRTPGALRQKAYALGISLGHRNKRK